MHIFLCSYMYTYTHTIGGVAKTSDGEQLD